MNNLSKLIAIGLLTAALASCATITQNTNSTALLEAAGQATTALTISDADVITLSKEFIVESDKTNTVATAKDAATIRLNKLVKLHATDNGIALNYKVYKSTEVNAFACADGSIRVYEGLMKAMTDQEILAIIGHEIGHVKNGDVLRGMRNAYLMTAARTAVGATNTTIGALTKSQLGDLAIAFGQSQFSKKQEYAADDYSLNFLKRGGYDLYSMSNALNKLVLMEAQGGQQADMVSALFSSHPESKDRAARSKKLADQMKASK